ncbi:MAG: DASS family sodium-coupled anion symporter [Gammaproteobacteria bacterium]|nr:DASS family sodium-coupled anion symporter [Gammaproteobacteria bacterium]
MQLGDRQYSAVQKFALVLGPLLFLALYNAPFVILNPAADKVLAVAVWMIVWWISEAVSISVTALLPLTIFPLLGIADIEDVAAKYGSPTVFLFFGGFVMALALEKVNLHKRIALTIIKLTGTSPDRIILGFMLATAFLSMWISNTATTVVMLPIALSVVGLLLKSDGPANVSERNFALCLMLGIAYAANVGGVATIIGTPPNVVAVGFLQNELGIEVSFLNWMLLGVPFSALMLAVVFVVLVKWVYPNGLLQLAQSHNVIDSELTGLGPLSARERRVLIIFSTVIAMWVLRTSINQWLPFISLSDAGISLLAAVTLFALPFNFRSGDFILDWSDTVKLPWGILILFGGGLALAGALSDTGVIQFIGDLVSDNKTLSLLLVSAALIAIMLFMTELMSNVALTAIFVPVVAGIALGLDQSVMSLVVPVTMAASCAFMLPMATPPNAIVFSSGHIKVHQMVRAGIVLNLVSIVLLVIFARILVPLVFN